MFFLYPTLMLQQHSNSNNNNHFLGNNNNKHKWSGMFQSYLQDQILCFTFMRKKDILNMSIHLLIYEIKHRWVEEILVIFPQTITNLLQNQLIILTIIVTLLSNPYVRLLFLFLPGSSLYDIGGE